MKSVIYGCKGLELNQQEIHFFSQEKPFGFILFKRNIASKEQVKALVQQFKDVCGHSLPIILIDQEGGRVARLQEPNWRKAPACEVFGKLHKQNPDKAITSLQTNCQLIAHELQELGINCVCAPMLDIKFSYSNNIIGDRAFCDNKDVVESLGKTQANEYIKHNILPIIKHIPGHGRATLDSHLALPIVDASFKDLEAVDFAPFKALNSMPLAMTAHITYTAIDEQNCATLSKKAIDIIRNNIGFTGLIMTDDLSMKALGGSFASRTELAYNAGCDIILHCNGNMQEMQEIATKTTIFNAKQLAQIEGFYPKKVNPVFKTNAQFTQAADSFSNLLASSLA